MIIPQKGKKPRRNGATRGRAAALLCRFLCERADSVEADADEPNGAGSACLSGRDGTGGDGTGGGTGLQGWMPTEGRDPLPPPAVPGPAPVHHHFHLCSLLYWLIPSGQSQLKEQ